MADGAWVGGGRSSSRWREAESTQRGSVHAISRQRVRPPPPPPPVVHERDVFGTVNKCDQFPSRKN
ncbi:hypothetical protein ACP4OV_021991 [Aristida adscensionis]